MMKAKAIKLKDVEFGSEWADKVEHRWEYDDFQKDPRWREGWISFDCLLHNPDDDRVYCGITCFNAAGIFHAWDRKSREFVDLGYSRVADPFDAKFHRALVRAGDGDLYAAAALLHCPDRHMQAPGGPIIRYRPSTGGIERLATPVEHTYIQAIVMDEKRGTIYAQCFPPEYLVAFDMRTRQTRVLALTGSGIAGMTQGENMVLDDEGCVWTNWSLTRAWQSDPGPDIWRICKYDPRRDEMVFFPRGLPYPDGRPGFARVESFFNFGTGCLYASAAGGALYRLDPSTGDARFLFRAVGDEGRGRRSRLAAMVMGPGGFAYGITGRDGECELLRFNPRDDSFSLLGPVRDSDSGEPCWQVHDICVAPDGVLYAGENDHPHRSGYLWEIHV